jgi:hypothetical protein
MKAWLFRFIMLLCLSSGTMAFTTKKLDPMVTRPGPALKAAVAASSKRKERDDTSPLPLSGNTPAFARPQSAMHHLGGATAPAVYNDEDEEYGELFSYGAALVSCVISLALGFTLGYGT